MKRRGEDKRPMYRWVMLFVSFYAFVAFAFTFQLAPPLIPSILEEFDITHAGAGLIMSIVLVPGIFLSLPAGLFVERYGVRRIGFASLICVVLGCSITAAANSFVMLLTGRLVLGLGGSIVIPATSAIIAQWFKREELGKAMGIFGINMPLAAIMAFPSASMLDLTYDWRFPFYIGLAMGVTAALFFLGVVRESSFAAHKKETSVRQAIGNPEIWKVGLVWLFFNAAALSFTTWAPKLFETFKGIPKVDASLLASLLMLVSIICVPIYGSLSDRTGRRRYFAIVGSLLMTIALVALAYTSDLALIASIIAFGVTSAMVPPIATALPAEILGPGLAGVGFGITGICQNLGAAAAQPLVGFILDMSESYTFCLLGMAALSAFGALVAYTLKTA